MAVSPELLSLLMPEGGSAFGQPLSSSTALFQHTALQNLFLNSLKLKPSQDRGAGSVVKST